MAYIDIQHVTHSYDGEGRALDDVSYSIERGEFFSLLGPSGCGKSTLLNIIGGFVDPTAGSVLIDGSDILGLAPYRRNIGVVFQGYALFPHLSVFNNVAYGLRVKRWSKARIAARVQECLALVQLDGFEKRMPRELSGGQRQRVAIARALAGQPDILMLDEPLGNLDAKLRKEMRAELRGIQQRSGVTTIMVTHDQEEAMTISDRIGIMRHGVVQQVGTPEEVYRHPANSFVAGFLGDVNMTPVVRSAEGVYVSSEWKVAGQRPVAFGQAPSAAEGAPLVAVVRPEDIEVVASRAAGALPVRVASVSYAGSFAAVRASFEGGGALQLRLPTADGAALPSVGDELYVRWSPDSALLVQDVGR